MQLDAARNALREGRPADALDRMLEAWRDARDPALADLIDRVAAKLAEPLKRVSGDRLHVKWIDRFAENHPSDLPVLMAVWRDGPPKQVKQRLEGLLERAPDPRITRPLVKGLSESFGYSVTPAERTVWTRVLKLVVHTGDIRVVPGLQEIAHIASARIGAFGHEPYGYDDLVRRIASTVPKIEPAGPPLDLAALEEAVTALEQGPRLAAGVARPERATLRAGVRESIYENPDDDGAIAVWADLLSEAGDDLGTFVALQLRHAKKPLPKKDQSVMRRLQKANVARLLGPLAPVVDPASAVFRRGLLHAAKVTLRTAEHRSELVHHPFWRSVRQIQTTSAHLRCESLAGVERSGMRLVPEEGGFDGPVGYRFTSIAPPAFTQLTELARSRTPLGLRSICVAMPNRNVLAADCGPLEDPRGLPSLDELHLVDILARAQRDPDPVARLGLLAAVPLVSGVRRLVLDGFYGYHDMNDPFTVWRDLGRRPGQQLVFETPSEWFAVVTGDSDGLSLDASIARPTVWALEALQRLLPVPARFTRIRIHSPPWSPRDFDGLERLLAPVHDVDLPKVKG
ncbi:MAG: hypothetical protein H6737_15150 [Alphaproteobacteria bacterium]|nr:hypothetical protein [Alphaproteobacteria bacterium]